MSQKPRLPIPWFPLAEVAQDFGCTVLNLVALADAGHIEILRQQVLGELLDVISAEDRAKLEAMLSADKPERERTEHPGKVKSALFLLGAGMAVWSGEDPALMQHHYEMRDFLESDFASKGIRMMRSRETDAELIAEAFKVLHESGLYQPPEQRERAEAIRQAIAAHPDAQEKAA